MKRIALFLLTLVAATSVAQVKEEQTPFEKSPYARYVHSTVNEYEFRKMKFDVASIQLSLRHTLPKGVSAPRIEPALVGDGKLEIYVEIWPNDFPKTVDGRKTAMMQAVEVAKTAYALTVGVLVNPQGFRDWTRVEFVDIVKFGNYKESKSEDPFIGTFENGDLVLR